MPEDELVAANGLLGSVSPMALMVVGPGARRPPVGVRRGAGAVVDAATFGVSALCVLLLRPLAEHARGPRALPWADFREGLGYVRRTPWLATNLLAGLVITFTVSGTITMLPFLVSRGYHAPVASFGYLIAVGGVAATVAAVVVGTRPAPRRPLMASYLTYALGLGAIAGLGLAPNLLVAGVCMAVFFVGATVGNVFQDSVLGSRVPRELRGRVSSLDWVAATAAAPLSVVVAAVSADQRRHPPDVRRGRPGRCPGLAGRSGPAAPLRRAGRRRVRRGGCRRRRSRAARRSRASRSRCRGRGPAPGPAA